MEANAQLIPPKYFVSLAKLEAKTTTHLQYILLAQCVAYIIGMLLQLWFFRWYNMTAAFIGVVSLYPGFYGQAKKSLNSLLVFLFFQGVGGAVVLVAACYSFLTLAWRDENDDCVDRGECVSALVHKVAGGGAVCMLIFLYLLLALTLLLACACACDFFDFSSSRALAARLEASTPSDCAL
ncbi:MAG: hypothetical protein MHM6MM_007418 [Cercozoa sp. M6MM]